MGYVCEIRSKQIVEGVFKTKQVADSVHYLGAAKTNARNKLTNIYGLTLFIKNALSELEASVLGELEYSFSTDEEQYGYTAVYCLAESHIAIHTWPEHDFVEFDVYLCNNMKDNSEKCRLIYEKILNYYRPIKFKTQKMIRPTAAGAFQDE